MQFEAVSDATKQYHHQIIKGLGKELFVECHKVATRLNAMLERKLASYTFRDDSRSKSLRHVLDTRQQF